MPGSYKQLDFAERQQVYFLRKQGLSCRGIARQLGRSPSTISRELRRNSGGRGYRFSQAQRMAWERRSETSSVPRKMTGRMWAIVEGKLAMQWSPGRGRSAMQWIYRPCGSSAISHLRRRGTSLSIRRGHIRCERPGAVQLSVGGGHARSLDIGPRPISLCSEGVVVKRLLPYMEVVHTITSDNGKEFAGHGKIAQELGTGFFFATPYHSWERGLNEHTNGLVRQYFPKATDFHEVLGEDVRRVEELLNGRPRKVLNYRTPAEVFNEASC